MTPITQQKFNDLAITSNLFLKRVPLKKQTPEREINIQKRKTAMHLITNI